MRRFGVALALIMGLTPLGHAQAPPRDANLPSVKPEALQKLSDNRVRQQVMQESQAAYPGRCVCSFQTTDSTGRSCKGRHETITTSPAPICRPGQVTPAMVSTWRRAHP